MQPDLSYIAILGAGESGTGAAVLAKSRGAQVWLSDAGQIQDTYRAVLLRHGIGFEEGGHTEEKIWAASIVVKSPGIPDKAPIVQRLREAGKQIVSEIEFGSWFTDARIVALTGSNGKTTTTSLVWHLLHTAGYDVALGGNIGQSFAYLVATATPAWYVLEVSSFQLDDIQRFRPDVAVLLNITPDHLDRYQYNLDLYAAAKFRIAENQTPADVFIYCQDDPGIMSRLEAYPIAAQRQGFALAAGPDTYAWLEDEVIMAGGEVILPFADTRLMGRHNQLNTLSAVLAARACGVPVAAIREGLRTFRPIEHRLEPVTTAGDVLYINDSKATNVDSVFFALEGMTRPVIWLAGGVDKGNDYTVLQPLVRDKVKAIVTLGPDTDKFYRAFDKPVFPTMHMTDAVATAVRLATPGDVVLLSPACASFDLFRNYEDRGRQFKDAVMKTVQHIHP